MKTIVEHPGGKENGQVDDGLTGMGMCTALARGETAAEEHGRNQNKIFFCSLSEC